MNNFLHNVCQDIYTKHKNIFKETIIVFPNKRAGVFFKKHLEDVVKETIWLPKVTTLNEFIEELSGMQKDDNMSLIFKLYHIYKGHTKTEESFDDFYYWGEMLLNDFDDIDKYLVDAKDLFKNLKSLKEIDSQFDYLTEEQIKAIKKFWSAFAIENISQNQTDFIVLWEKLYAIYSDFKKQLNKEGVCYEGMGYRLIDEKIRSKKLDIKSKKIIIVGFNALNRCEEKLFTHLKNINIAEFYWDYDSYYVNNENNEAGIYMRKNLKSFPNNFKMDNYNVFKQKEKTVEIYSVPSDIGQTKILSTHLENINKDDLEQNAIILGDENLLIPTIHSIPKTINAVNVTMGYPAQNSTVAGFIRNIVDLQTSVKSTKESTLFYFKPLIAILNHQFINTGNANNDIKKIKDKNKVYITKSYLSVDDKTLNIFDCPQTGIESGNYLLKVLQDTFHKLEKIDTDENLIKIEKEYLFHLYTSIKRTNSILEEYKIELAPKTYYHIISKIIKGLSIPFEGEPLAGLQVMGLMETRLLDFDNLYVLSSNEGKLPKTSSSQSYIPYNLRKGFGLPTIEHQDSIYAYYFYRLIQRAKNIKFYYSTRADGIRTGEMSRFLYQLKYESGLKIKEHNVINEISVENKKDISYPKDSITIDKLTEIACNKDKPLSPTAINEYLACKLRFYFKYISRLKEEDDVTEDIDPRIFGMIFHDTMELIYKPLIGKSLDKTTIENIIKDKKTIQKHLSYSFEDNYLKEHGSTSIEGKDRVIYDILFKYIIEVLNKDKSYAPLKIIATEGEYRTTINIDGKQVYIKGYIDRIDETEDSVRILDYKTGKANCDFKSVEELFGEDSKKHNKAALQTLLYCMMYEPNVSNGKMITPGIYALKDIFGKNYEYRLTCKPEKKKVAIKDYKEYKFEIENGLKDLLIEMFDTKKAFTQTDDVKTCDYCAFRELCHK